MSELRVVEYLGSGIEFKAVCGEIYANATSMCKPFGKLSKDWLKTAQTQRYIMALEQKDNYPNGMILVSKGGIVEDSGTWIHEKLVLKLSSWLDVEFELWIDEQIATLIREGEVSMKPKIPQTYAEALLEAGRLALENEQLVENNKKLEIENLVSKQIIADNEPKVNYYDRLLADTKTILGVNQISKDYDLSGTKLNRILVEEKVQYFQNKTYLLYANYVGKGYTKSKPYELPNGEFKYHLYWTQKGRVLIHNILEKRGIHPIEVE
jgi:phage antirepressor YoqD-like protein